MEISVRRSGNCCGSNDVGGLSAIVSSVGDLAVDDRVVAVRDPLVRTRAVVERDRVEEVLRRVIGGGSNENRIRWRGSCD